jgi:hypothetical protein
VVPRKTAGRASSTRPATTSTTPTPVSMTPVMLGDQLARHRARRNDDSARFGPPSTFGLSAAELATHIRDCRRAGWLRWELRVRFGRWAA